MKKVLTARAVMLLLFLFASIIVFAQDKPPVNFGKITPQDFILESHFDSSSGAVYIADVGTSEFTGNNKNWFTLVFKRQLRMKIITKSGFDHATFSIPLYREDNREEKLEKVVAVTYNLEGGKVEVIKLDDKSIFQEKQSKRWVTKKFTLPAVKEGSIIEVSYTIKSDFLFNLQPWNFQGYIPRLWSEYRVSIPEFFDYVLLPQGYHPFYIQSNKSNYQNFTVEELKGIQTDRTDIGANVYTLRWVMKDVPPMKEEKFTSTIGNYVSRLDFQLSKYRFPNVPEEGVMSSWTKVTDQLMKDDQFGLNLYKGNYWLDDDLKQITAGCKNDKEKTRKIYEFVRDRFTATGSGGIMLSRSFKDIFKQKAGSVAEINLLLVAMLRHENIPANPVILSTRNNGFINTDYPLMDKFNYVVVCIPEQNQTLYLDATVPRMGYGKLPLDCYNGAARMIDENDPKQVFLLADSIKEQSITTCFLSNDAKNNRMEGKIIGKPGYYQSLQFRDHVKDKGLEGFAKELKSQYPAEYEVKNVVVDSLNAFDEPVSVEYSVSINLSGEDIIYLNPMMAEAVRDNDFKSAERFYPVEMPYSKDQIFILNMDVPEGYAVEELPKSARVDLNSGQGNFEYLIGITGKTISLRSRLQIKKATFRPEDYEGLRGFFDYVVKKHAEQIVLKKKANP